MYNLLSLADNLSDTSQNLAVVDLDADAHTKLGEDGIHNLHQLYLVEKRIRANHIGITLIELTVTTLLRAVSTPYRLNLIALERHLEFFTMLDYVTGKRYSQVVAKSLFAELGSKLERSERMNVLIAHLIHIVS